MTEPNTKTRRKKNIADRPVPDSPDPQVQMKAADPRDFFDSDGLLVTKVADEVIRVGPLAQGKDDIMWSYHSGVWLPDKDAIRTRVASLLGDRYRRSHCNNVEDVVRSRVVKIYCDPVSEAMNFRNGLYYWQTDELREHSSDVLSTVQLGVDWNPDAKCPRFDQFLSEVVPEDMVPLMWELIGYLMYSGNPLHKAVMLVGSGRNGKGTFLRVMNELLGVRNVTSVSLHSLSNNRFSTSSLFGKIANIAGDIDPKYMENTAMFKAITGQDQVPAERKGRDQFDFTPWAVPVFSANKVPPSADVSLGYLSRWLVVPFPNTFRGKEDRTLDARLQVKREMQGIAAKAVPALRSLMQRGDFDLPESGEEAFEEFARRVDQVRTWMADACELDPKAWTPRPSLYQAYRSWAMLNNYTELRSTEVYDRLVNAGCKPTKRRGAWGFSGVRVRDVAARRTG